MDRPFSTNVEIAGPFNILSNILRLKATDRKPVDTGKPVSSVKITISGVEPNDVVNRILDGSGLKDINKDKLEEHSSTLADMWQTNKDQKIDWIEFDLGTVRKLDVIQVWNFNQKWFTKRGLKKADISVWNETDGWKKVSEDVEFGEAEGSDDYDEPTIIKLNGVEAAKVRFDDLQNLGDPDYTGLSEVRFYEVKGPQAMRPQPIDGAMGASPNTISLQWASGTNAVAHNLYFGTEPNSLEMLGKIENEAVARLSGLASNTKYFWRIDEVQSDGSVVTGQVWSFNTSELIGFWKLDESQGDTAEDSSGNKHTGRLMNNPTWRPDGGKVGGALEFDGEDDYVEVDYTDDLPAWTLSIWVKSSAPPSIEGNPSGPVSRDKNFQINWNHIQETFLGAAGVNVNGQWYAASFNELKADTWYHLAATYDGENLKSYKNGSLVSYNPAPSGEPESESQKLTFGKHVANPWYFKGLLDDVRIYNYALGKDDIKTIYSGRELASGGEASSGGKVTLVTETGKAKDNPD